VTAEADDPATYFKSLGFDLRIEQRDLHAEYMATGEPGRASFFVEGRRYYCIDLLRDGGIVAPRYSQGETVDDALGRAQRRFRSEQR